MAFIRSGGVRILLVLVLLLAFGAGAGATFIYVSFLRDLPDLRSVEDYQPALTSRVLDHQDRPIGIYATERRELAPIGSLPDHVGMAFVAAEDSKFYEHAGIDWVSIVRAAWVDIRAGGIKQGASTITMQLVKQMLLSPERRFSRKLREMVLARKIEQHFTKDEILYLYLNQIYFGSGAWGIEEAARTYFAKPAAELSISEAALLAGLPQRPSAYSPFANPKLAEGRRSYVLWRMLAEGVIDQTTYDDALANPPALAGRKRNEDFVAARFFTEEVRRYLFERLGGDAVLEGGLTIETTLDIELQKAAVAAVRKGLEDHDKRRGYTGPVRRVSLADLSRELDTLAETNQLLPDDDGARIHLEVGEVAEGIVMSVDPDAGFAIVAFAPGVEGEVALPDVDWAREADVKRRPRPVKQIAQIFEVGDVARFVRLDGPPLIARDAAGGSNRPLSTADMIGEGFEDDTTGPADPPLVRLSVHQSPKVEGALLSMEVETGDVRAMVGGYDYDRSQFNRATQALRQPGSAFKPFIYGAALSRDYTPVSTLWDRPAVYEDPISGFVWRPQNYSRHFFGPMPMRAALVRSVNNATVHLFRDIGVDYVIDYARRLGIQSPLSRDLSLALGSSSVNLVELTSAYAVFPNHGRRVTPRFITRVTDRDGTVLLENIPLGKPPPPLLEPLEIDDLENQEITRFETEDADGDEDPEGDGYPDAEIVPSDQVISEAAAYLMCDLLEAVVKDPRGTGWRLRELGRPLAGKTGTTNDQKDAWFMGFSPGIVTGVWVGRDDSTILGWGETGSRAAAPIWVDYMREALAGRPVLNFQEPEDIVTVRIDRTNGLLADVGTAEAYFQPFLEGTEPSESTTSRKSAGDTQRTLREDFF